MTHHEEIFTDREVGLDGHSFFGCSFTKCRIVYDGTGDVTMNGNHFTDCEWVFDGAAGSMVKFLKVSWQSGNREFVERVFDFIRDGEAP